MVTRTYPPAAGLVGVLSICLPKEAKEAKEKKCFACGKKGYPIGTEQQSEQHQDLDHQ